MTWEDQQRINKFSRLHAIYSDLEDEIKARRTEREDLEDLSLELELREDEMILYVGYCRILTQQGTKLGMRT